MSQFVPIALPSSAGTSYELDSAYETAGVLTIRLSESDSSSIEICFDRFVAYRKMFEGDALRTLSELGGCGLLPNTLFESADSNFLDWFWEETFHAFPDRQLSLKEYLITTIDDVFEVLSPIVPSVKLLPRSLKI